MWAQRPSSPTYIVVQSRAGLPLSYAHVVQINLQTASKEVKEAFTDDMGRVPLFFSGKISLKITLVGYKAFHEVLDTSQVPPLLIYRLETTTTELPEVVITGQFAPRTTEEAVHKIRVLNRARIEKQGAVVLSDLLANEMNIGLAQDNLLGSSVSIQGISGQNVGIIVDGVPLLGRLNGSLDANQIFLHNVERVEIVEGPFSVNYGTNTLAGLVHIVTKQGGKEKLRGSLSSYYESVGQYNMVVDGGLTRPNYWVSVSTGGNYFDGWSAYQPSRFQQWNPKRQYFGHFQYGRRFQNTSIRFQSSIFDEMLSDKGAPRGPSSANAFDDEYDTFRTTTSFFLSQPVGSGDSPLDLTFSYGYYKRLRRAYFIDLITRRRATLETDGASIFDLALMRGVYPLFDATVWRWQVGYDLSMESAYGSRIQQQIKRVGNYALFSNAEWTPWLPLTFRLGFRYAYNTLYTLPPIPSFHLRYKVGHSILRAAYARGFRSPSLKERYFSFVDVNHNIVGNQRLRHETSHNMQFHWNWKKGRELQVLSTEVGGYYNNISDLITLAQTTSLNNFSYVNVGAYKTLGFQAKGSMKYWGLHLQLGGGYAWLYRLRQSEDTSSFFPPVPEGRVNFSYDWESLAMGVALFYKYTGESPRFLLTDEGLVQTLLLQDFHTADLTFTKHLWEEIIVWRAGIKNIFDVRNIATQAQSGVHTSSSAPIAWGRSYFTKIVVTL